MHLQSEIGEHAFVGAGAVVILPERDGQKLDIRDSAGRLAEAVGLARAIYLHVRHEEIIRIRKASAATLLGKGQIERIAAAVAATGSELVVIDGVVSPIQQRNLEKAFGAKVIDRTGLILEIFGERASTKEGTLQVELAHLQYQASRLVRSWTHLERQRGGFGFLGGPGETQIEADRRMIRDRMGRIRRELEQVRRTRGLHRERRGKAPWPVVALVGYINAGQLLGSLRVLARTGLHYQQSFPTALTAIRHGMDVGEQSGPFFMAKYEDVFHMSVSEAREALDIRGAVALDSREASLVWPEYR